MRCTINCQRPGGSPLESMGKVISSRCPIPKVQVTSFCLINWFFLGFWYLFPYQRKVTCSLSEEFFSNLPQRLILDFLWHCGHLSMYCVGGWGITFFIEGFPNAIRHRNGMINTPACWKHQIATILFWPDSLKDCKLVLWLCVFTRSRIL